jgi:hypothetical protein
VYCTHLAGGHVDNARIFHRDGEHLGYGCAVNQDIDGRAPKA